MTLAAFPAKYRAKYSRNKAGCFGCRSRRKKCDGNKPVCAACLSREIECQWPSAAASDIPSGQKTLNKSLGRGHDNVQEPSTELQAHDRRIITTLYSSVAEKQQLRAAAASLFGPDAAFRNFSPYWRMLQCASNKQDAFTLALDTLTLSQLGVTYKDRRLIHQATRTHCHAVQRLQGEIQRAAGRASIMDTMLSTPYLLFLCQRFRHIAISSGDSSQPVHLLGLAQLLNMATAAPSDVYNLLVDDCQLYALEWSMVYGRKLNWTLPKTNTIVIESIPFRCPRFTQHMMKAPDFLSEAGLLISASTQPHSREDLVQQCSSFLDELQHYERDLMSLFHSWMEESSSCGFDITDAASLPSHDRQLDALSQSVFGVAFSFSSFAHACMHKRFWQCVHFVRDIGSRVRLAVHGPSVSESSDMSQNTSIIADNICRAVVFICAKVENGSHGYYCSRGPLELLRPWYKTRGFAEKVAWCDALDKFLQEKGMYTGQI